MALVNGALRAWVAVLGIRATRRQPILRAAVIRHGNIGDHIAATPAYREIRGMGADCWLVLMTSVGGARAFGGELLDLAGAFDEVRPLTHGGGLRGLIRTSRALRAANVDYLWYLPSDKAKVRQVALAALMVRYAGIRRASGFEVAKIRLFRRWQVRCKPFASESQRLLTLVRRVIPACPRETTLSARTLAVAHRAVDLVPPVVAICPGGEVPVNRWPLERYRELCRALVEDLGCSVAVVGGAGDAAAGEELIRGLPFDRARNFAGGTTLLTAAELLTGCSVLVSNDTGVGHLAAAVGTPVVTILSSRDFPGTWLPDGPNIGIRHSVSCEVCYRKTCPTMHCIRGIGVAPVLDAVRRITAAPLRQIVHV